MEGGEAKGHGVGRAGAVDGRRKEDCRTDGEGAVAREEEGQHPVANWVRKEVFFGRGWVLIFRGWSGGGAGEKFQKENEAT